MIPLIRRGRGAGGQQRPRTKVQRLNLLLPDIPRITLAEPHYTPGCRHDPTRGHSKKVAADLFEKWWAQLPPMDVTVFSDGSEQHTNGSRKVSYGYAIYQNGSKIHEGQGSLHPDSHVFDAEAIGAWRGLQQVLKLPELRPRRIYMCIDSTSVIRCLRGNASQSSQWAFLECHGAMEVYDIRVKWAPGHTGIAGNEEADRLADSEARNPSTPEGAAQHPTVSGMRTIARRMLGDARRSWWTQKQANLSQWYNQWSLDYNPGKAPEELSLPRAVLSRFLALRTSHGDFAWYHRKFNHEDANTKCSCGMDKTPDHIVHCRKTTSLFMQWPNRPYQPPTGRKEGLDYISNLLQRPRDFEAFLNLTEYYDKICTR